MERVSVSLKIFGKSYPLKIEESHAAKFVEAQNEIDKKIEFYRKMGVLDKQDMLAMIVFDATMESLGTKERMESESEDIRQMLDGLIAQLDS